MLHIINPLAFILCSVTCHEHSITMSDILNPITIVVRFISPTAFSNTDTATILVYFAFVITFIFSRESRLINHLSLLLVSSILIVEIRTVRISLLEHNRLSVEVHLLHQVLLFAISLKLHRLKTQCILGFVCLKDGYIRLKCRKSNRCLRCILHLVSRDLLISHIKVKLLSSAISCLLSLRNKLLRRHLLLLPVHLLLLRHLRILTLSHHHMLLGHHLGVHWLASHLLLLHHHLLLLLHLHLLLHGSHLLRRKLHLLIRLLARLHLRRHLLLVLNPRGRLLLHRRSLIDLLRLVYD